MILPRFAVTSRPGFLKNPLQTSVSLQHLIMPNKLWSFCYLASLIFSSAHITFGQAPPPNALQTTPQLRGDALGVIQIFLSNAPEVEACVDIKGFVTEDFNRCARVMVLEDGKKFHHKQLFHPELYQDCIC